MALPNSANTQNRFPGANSGGIGVASLLHSNVQGYQPQRQPAGDQDDVSISVDPETGLVGIASGVQANILPNGDIQLTAEGAKAPPANRNESFDANLADEMDSQALGTLASDLIEGIEADLTSRQDWVSTYTRGMDLLGLKIEQSGNTRNRKKNSTVVHPLMLEAIVTFQSLARAEILPSGGPAKVRNDAAETEDSNQAAADFEKDLNHYLTTVATEYYPDTDRALFYLGYGGTIFKKVYSCPVRKRPVSEAVYLPDLIVSNEATDLQNAPRVTHQIQMTRTQVRRLQLNGFYRDIDLAAPSPVPSSEDQIQQKERSIAGRQPVTISRPQDVNRTIWECYCEIVPDENGLSEPGAPAGLPLPYVVTMDRTSRVVLAVRRNWKIDDTGDNGYRRKKMFVKFGMVPSFGFLDLGFLHLNGNQTRALTAIWRILIDAGLYSNFPGGMRVKGTRQSSNEITPGPGEWTEVETGPMDDIRKAFMGMPYNPPNPVFMQLAENIADRSARLGGAVEMEVGEGRTNAPVGTVMAMIEQQTQVMAAVHKRLHTAQGEELQLLRDLFLEDPEALSRLSRCPARQWKMAEEFSDLDLVPASDPNTPSGVHRLMQANALMMIYGTPAGQEELDGRAVIKRVLTGIQVPATDDLLKPVPAQPQGDGGQQAGVLALAGKQLENDRLGITVKAQGEQDKRALEREKIAATSQDKALDRESKQKIAELQAQIDLIIHGESHALEKAGQAHQVGLDLMQATAATQGLAAQQQPPQGAQP